MDKFHPLILTLFEVFAKIYKTHNCGQSYSYPNPISLDKTCFDRSRFFGCFGFFAKYFFFRLLFGAYINK